MTFSSLFREVFAEVFLYFSFRTLREVSFSSSGLFFFVCEKREEKIFQKKMENSACNFPKVM